MSLPEFKNEAEFRTEWIAPFLSKLGYILPTHNHGTGEQGKDFFFAEHDKFGHLRFNAAQVKLGNIGSGNSQLSDLLHQVRSCFDVTLNYHKGTVQQRISAVYIMTNGSISEEARRRISGYCEREHFGENVFYLDGETLDILERHATYIEDKTLRNRLVGLLNEANFNLEPIKKLIKTINNGEPKFEPCRTLALEDALRNPFPEDILPYERASKVWEAMTEINKRNVPYNISYKPDTFEGFALLANAANNWTVRMRDIVSEAIKKIDSLYSLDIEIEYPTQSEMDDSQNE